MRRLKKNHSILLYLVCDVVWCGVVQSSVDKWAMLLKVWDNLL